MSKSRSHKSPIPFDEVKKFDERGQLDIFATLGAIVKETYNRYPSETLEGNAKIKMKGNLRVTRYYAEQVFISSDDKLDERCLGWLDPWITENCQRYWQEVSVYISFNDFDREFILPYIDEFRTHLNGEHPLAHFLLKSFHKDLIQEKIKVDLHKLPILNLGKQPSTLLVAYEIKNSPLIRQEMKKVLKVKEVFEFSDDLLKLAIAEAHFAKTKPRKLITTLTDRVRALLAPSEVKQSKHSIFQSISALFIGAVKDKKSDPLFSLYILAATYRIYKKLFNVASLFETVRREVVDEILNLLPMIKADGLLQKYQPPEPASVEARKENYVGPTHSHNLLNLLDLDIISGVSQEIRKHITNLEHWEGIPYLLSILNDSNLSSVERQKFLSLIIDHGVSIKFLETVAYNSEIRFTLYKISRFLSKIQKPDFKSDVVGIRLTTPKYLIEFKQAIKLDADQKFDVVATLSELLKLTCNRLDNTNPKIHGTLQLKREKDFVLIKSDDEQDNLSLTMCGEEKGNSVKAPLYWVDYHFIHPYLSDFKAMLAGKHPLGFLLQDFDKLNPEQTRQRIFTENGIERFFYQERPYEYYGVRCFFTSEIHHHKEFSIWIIKTIHAISENSLYCKSLYADVVRKMTDYFIEELLPALSPDQLRDIPLQSLLAIDDRKLFSNVLIRLRKCDIDLKNLFGGKNAVCLFEKGSQLGSHIPTFERQWYIQRLYDEGIFTATEGSLEEDKFSKNDFAIICHEIYCCYQKVLADLLIFLSPDIANQVMRWIVGDLYVDEKVKSLKPKIDTNTITQSSATFFAESTTRLTTTTSSELTAPIMRA